MGFSGVIAGLTVEWGYSGVIVGVGWCMLIRKKAASSTFTLRSE